MPLDPLTLDPLPTDAALPTAVQQALRTEAAERLEQHRRRRGRNPAWQAVLPGMDTTRPAANTSRVAASVAARFAKSLSYRDFLQQEAETTARQAEAAAEIACRNADAIATAQQQLLEEIDRWDRQAAAPPQLPVPAAVALPQVAVPETGQHLPGMATRSSALSQAAGTMDAVQTTRKAAITPRPGVAAEPGEPPEPTTPIHANLIEFPRQLVATRKARPRLAEGPLREDADAAPERAQLRIFEVEASAFSVLPAVEAKPNLPEWSSIHLDSAAEARERMPSESQWSLALPVHAAPLDRRVMAAVVDGCCIVTGFLLAVAAAGMAGGALPAGPVALLASAGTLLLFAAGYLLLSFTLADHTPGMRYARIALCTFGDDNPTRSAMRRRMLATALSCVSLGLGFAWALLDDDKLGWHDRISRMYQRAY